MQLSDNKQLNESVRKIRQLIAASMDGITAAKMRASGLVYRQNFGVALPRLREIAADFEANAELAHELWQIDGRETKIVGLMLMPKQIALTEALDIAKQCSTNELIEIASKELFAQMECASDLIEALLNQDSDQTLFLACCTAAHCYDKLPYERIEQITRIISERETTLSVYNVALTLLTHVVDSEKYAEQLPNLIALLRQSSNETCHRIADWLS